MVSLNAARTRFPKPVVRLLAAGGFLIAFFTLTSIIDPSSSTATESMGTEYGSERLRVLGGEEPDPLEAVRLSIPSDAIVLGTLEGRTATVVITAGELEARYSVFTPQGELRVLEATLTELYELAPDLDVAGMIAGTSGMGELDQSVPVDLDHWWMY
jgi:hypothetical protein